MYPHHFITISPNLVISCLQIHEIVLTMPNLTVNMCLIQFWLEIHLKLYFESYSDWRLGLAVTALRKHINEVTYVVPG